jgi:predicted transcriptional regulator
MKSGTKMTDTVDTNLLACTATVVAAYVNKNAMLASDLPELIARVHAAFCQRTSGQSGSVLVDDQLKPAVNPKKSVHDDFIICLEDGKQFKSLKRHLATHYDLTPQQYRGKWNLPHDYPMVAPSYAATRSKLATQMGLGRKARDPKIETR